MSDSANGKIFGRTWPHPVRRVLVRSIARPEQAAAGLVLLTLLIGTVFYHLAEGWSILNSVYFCVITLATIGYGDFAPTTDIAKLFTIFYAFTGIGLLATYIQLRAQYRIEHKSLINKVSHEASELEQDIEHKDILPHDPIP